MTIWKWKLENKPAQAIEVPLGTRILCAQLDNENDICVWGIVNPAEKKTEKLYVAIVGTGWEIEDLNEWIYVDSIKDFPYIWHVFIKKEYKFGIYYQGQKIGKTNMPFGNLDDYVEGDKQFNKEIKEAINRSELFS